VPIAPPPGAIGIPLFRSRGLGLASLDARKRRCTAEDEERLMNGIIWLVGAVVIAVVVLGYLGIV
jgi:hypothetical protein